MIVDIKASAASKKQKNQKVTQMVLGARVLVLPLEDEVEETTPGGIILTEEQKDLMRKTNLMRALVKSVGTLSAPWESVKEGDTIYVFPTNFEAPVTLDGVGYLIYPERNILLKA